MWDRLKIVPQSSGRQTGHPLDGGGEMRVGLGIGYGGFQSAPPKGYSYSIKGGPAPQRPPREFFESRYLQPGWNPSITSPVHPQETATWSIPDTRVAAASETAPAVKEPPRRNPNRITVRTSNFRPTSSVYSEDSPPLASHYTANVATKYSYRYGGADDISPPSSPEPDVGHVDRFLPGDVSPIDEDDGPAYRHTGHPNTEIPRNDRSGGPYAAAEPRQGTQSPPQNRAITSIPMMRRERRRQSDAATRDMHPSQRGPAPQQSRNPHPRDAPRWDPLTGEQTSSSRSRPSQANPAEFNQDMGITEQGWAEPQNGTSAAQPSFGDRVRRIAKKAAAAREGNTDPAAGAFTSTRPGWRGASGRSAIVAPVHDTREVAPLRIPEKSSRRNIPPAAAPRSNNTPDGAVRRGQTPPISPPPSETPTRSAPREAMRGLLPSSQPPAATQTPSQTGQRYPSPPLSGNRVTADAPAVVAARELVRDGGHYAQPSPVFHSPEPANQLRRKPPPVHTNAHHQHQVSVSSVYSQQTEPLHHSPRPIADTSPPAEEPYVQPPSRFSITTYATSNTGTTRDDLDDHLDNDQPPVPSLPADYQQHYMGGRPSSDHSPVTSPIDQFMTSPFSAPPPVSRTPSTDPEQQPYAMSAAYNPALARALAIDRPSSRASDINKTLPPAPPEASADQAQDRVGLLNAQLRALANRRININRSIQQMTELMPTDKLMNSAEVVRKRESEKRKVEGLRQELADVQREEYELGLKLHRAYKRQDRDADWEPTTLWVRRVTG
ncbi:uncharacterized protein B0H64DRAFT_463596 [Chaetomium fimeti]|uniref:Uncharacterized protein n=1 Tax=Chaetomium fimeti TaxID=1854472 RepID=A0AAE0LRB5_9PEZI|nr:hypothetical protein B0H64DRAFT_463596 [Chaetomium fimeti]